MNPFWPRTLVLASASPRRSELLRQIGLGFTVEVADIDETPLPGEHHTAYTLRLAEAKARAVLERHPGAVVLGADTTVSVDDMLLGKPADEEDAARMLRLLSGRHHYVTTSVAVLTAEHTLTEAVTTRVTFSKIPEDELAAYVDSGEPMDKAGAYAIQGGAAKWIPRIEGEYSNVIGLPLARVWEILRGLKPE